METTKAFVRQLLQTIPYCPVRPQSYCAPSTPAPSATLSKLCTLCDLFLLCLKLNHNASSRSSSAWEVKQGGFGTLESSFARSPHAWNLESWNRRQNLCDKPKPSLHHDMGRAMSMADYFDDGDILIQLHDAEVRVHSLLMCLRCPFFRGLLDCSVVGLLACGGRQDGLRQVNLDSKNIHCCDFSLSNG